MFFKQFLFGNFFPLHNIWSKIMLLFNQTHTNKLEIQNNEDICDFIYSLSY